MYDALAPAVGPSGTVSSVQLEQHFKSTGRHRHHKQSINAAARGCQPTSERHPKQNKACQTSFSRQSSHATSLSTWKETKQSHKHKKHKNQTKQARVIRIFCTVPSKQKATNKRRISRGQSIVNCAT
mmetsp:Transcript_27476/g.74339  ORF Transcript_27476/g.74339 Transcript_27476/m.74339 type:complete len:127 (-) Transcript_27476:586-966(-)|eukprot:1161624-Pelagomonas_calceolata.AAC.9